MMPSQSTVAPAFLEPEKCRPAASGEVYNTRSTASCSRPSNNGSQGLSPSPQSAFLRRKTQKKWTDVHENYKTTAVIGQGTYGIVYKGEKRNSPNVDVALKRARLDAFTDFGIPETALREVTILRDLRHENVMHVAEISCSTSRLYMVCEYLEMDLKKFIRSHNRAVPKQMVKRITYEILKGLAFCHGHQVMHRDLKPHNILLGKDGSKVKLADFGLARPKHAPSKTITHDVVTLWYRAPELLLGECKYSDAIDMWSVGCIVAEMLSGKALFPGDSEIDTLFKIFRLFGTPSADEWPPGAVDPVSQFPVFSRKSNPFSPHISDLEEDAADLLQKLLLYDPSSRLSAMNALDHPWFDELRPCDPHEPVASSISSSTSVSICSSPPSSSSTSPLRAGGCCSNSGSTSAAAGALLRGSMAVRALTGHIESVTTATSLNRHSSSATSSCTDASSPSRATMEDGLRSQFFTHKVNCTYARGSCVDGGSSRTESSPHEGVLRHPQDSAVVAAAAAAVNINTGSENVALAKNRVTGGWWKWSRRQRSKTCTAVEEVAAAAVAASATGSVSSRRSSNSKGTMASVIQLATSLDPGVPGGTFCKKTRRFGGETDLERLCSSDELRPSLDRRVCDSVEDEELKVYATVERSLFDVCGRNPTKQEGRPAVGSALRCHAPAPKKQAKECYSSSAVGDSLRECASQRGASLRAQRGGSEVAGGVANPNQAANMRRTWAGKPSLERLLGDDCGGLDGGRCRGAPADKRRRSEENGVDCCRRDFSRGDPIGVMQSVSGTTCDIDAATTQDNGQAAALSDRRRLFGRCNILRCIVGDLCRSGIATSAVLPEDTTFGMHGQQLVSSSSSSSIISTSSTSQVSSDDSTGGNESPLKDNDFAARQRSTGAGRHVMSPASAMYATTSLHSEL